MDTRDRWGDTGRALAYSLLAHRDLINEIFPFIFYSSALHKAVVNGHLACAEALIAYGVCFSAEERPIAKPPYLTFLCFHQANLNSQNLGGDTPFRKAVYHGYTACARMLIEKGAEFDTVSERNISPLHLAVFKGKQESPRPKDLQPASRSIDVTGHLECAKLLLQKGADVNYKDESDMTPLFFCCRQRPL